MRQVHRKGKTNDEEESEEVATVSNSEVNTDAAEQPTLNMPDFQYACNECGRRFRLKCTLTAHRTIHSTDRPFECWMCHRSYVFDVEPAPQRNSIFFPFFRFKRRKLLKAHMRIHTQYPTIECDICGKRFRRNIQRDNHIKERHGAPVPKREKKPPPPPRARELKNPNCFSGQIFVMVHLITAVRKFTCELCGMSFTQRGGLFTHMTVHSDNRPHKCDVCGLG